METKTRRVKTGGRKLGSINRRTVILRQQMERVAERLAETCPERFEDGVAFLQWCYNDSNLPIMLRIEAAKCASRFERPTLSMARVEATGADGGPIRTESQVHIWLPDNGRGDGLFEARAYLNAAEADEVEL